MKMKTIRIIGISFVLKKITNKILSLALMKTLTCIRILKSRKSKNYPKKRSFQSYIFDLSLKNAVRK